jgi:hypothetical protein
MVPGATALHLFDFSEGRFHPTALSGLFHRVVPHETQFETVFCLRRNHIFRLPLLNLSLTAGDQRATGG